MMLTDPQRSILDYIVECQRNGYTPTRREMQVQFGFKSPNSVQKHLQALEKKGCIRVNKHKARMIVVVGGFNMGMLDKVRSDAPTMPPRIVIYAGEKFGKSSLGAHSPKPIFIMSAGETGLLTLIEARQLPPTPHFPECTTWPDVWIAVQELVKEKHDFQTVVFDTGNGLEHLCAKQICEDNFGGDWGERGFASFGRGNEQTSKEWARFLLLLDELRVKRGMTVIILHHAKIKTVLNPSGKDFDQWRPEALEKCWALTHKWADVILRGAIEVQVKDDKVQGEVRCLLAESTSSSVCGNRYGLPAKINAPSGAQNLWNAFADALAKAKGKPTKEPAKPDWVSLAINAADADDLNSIVNNWAGIPKATQTVVDAESRKSAQRLGLTFDKPTKKWIPTPKPVTGNGSWSPATGVQLEEIDSLLPASGMSMAEALDKQISLAGVSIISPMQLSSEQAIKVIDRLRAAADKLQGAAT